MSPARIILAAAICLPLAWLAVRLDTSDMALYAGRYQQALARDPRSAPAAAATAGAELLRGQAAAAQASARSAVAGSPLSQPAVRALALAEQALGDVKTTDALMTRAAALGWRDSQTQAWLLGAGLRTGAWDMAAERIDALARHGGEDAQRLFPLIRNLAADPAAGPAMVARIARHPNWRTPFFYAAERMSPDDFAAQDAMIAHLATTTAPMSRDESRAYISRLLIAGDFLHARAVWLTLPNVARYSGGRPVYDGGFDHVLAGPDHILFEWVLPDNAGSSASVSTDAGGSQLAVTTGGSEPATLATQFLILPPGPHMLSVDRLDGDPGARDRFHWRLYCLPRFTFAPSIPAGEGRHGGMIRERTRFDVPAENCAYQQLALRAEPGTLPGESQARFDNVAIDE